MYEDCGFEFHDSKADYPPQIELLTVEFGQQLLPTVQEFPGRPGCTSILAYGLCPATWQRAPRLLPGLYLKDDNLNHIRRVTIRSDEDSFAVIGHGREQIHPDMLLRRYALLSFDCDGDILAIELGDGVQNPYGAGIRCMIVLERDQAYFIVDRANSL